MFMLDTDTFTHLLYERREVVVKALTATAAGEVVASVISKLEILRDRIEPVLKADGRDRFLEMQRQLLIAESAIQKSIVIPLNDAALDVFERNMKHFSRVPQLKFANWVD